MRPGKYLITSRCHSGLGASPPCCQGGNASSNHGQNSMLGSEISPSTPARLFRVGILLGFRCSEQKKREVKNLLGTWFTNISINKKLNMNSIILTSLGSQKLVNLHENTRYSLTVRQATSILMSEAFLFKKTSG